MIIQNIQSVIYLDMESSSAPGSNRTMSAMQYVMIFFTLAALCLFFIPSQADATTTINEQFGPATINQGDSSLYTITISNDSTVPLASAMATVFLDNTSLSPNTSGGNITIVDGTVLSNTCNFSSVTAVAGTSKIVLSGGTIPAGSVGSPSICTFSLNVTSITPGTYHAYIPAHTIPDANTSGYTAQENSVEIFNETPADITLQVNALSAPTGSKTFSPSPAIAGDPITLTITLTNPNAGSTMPLTTFTDTLPDDGSGHAMVVANPAGASVNCTGTGASNGTLSAVSGSGVITLTGGIIGRSGTCTISVNVTVSAISGTSQSLNNSLGAGAIGNTRGLTSPAFNRNLTVNSPVAVSKSFNPTTVPSGQASLMTITINNNSTTNVLNITSFDDNLTGTTLKILTTSSVPLAASANPSVTCDGVGAVNGPLNYTADTLDTTLSLSGATAGRKSGSNGKCVITAYVTSTTDGGHTNNILADAVTNPNGYHSPAANATLNVNAQLTVNKTRSVGNVAPGQWTRFTVTINNWSGAAVTNVSFRDDLPANGSNQMVLDGSNPYSLSAGCTGGTWTGNDGDSTLQWTGGTIVAGSGVNPGVCTIVVQARLPLTATTGMTFSNQIPAYDGGTGVGVGGDGNGPGGHVVNPSASPAANVVTVDSLAISKSFSPTSIAQGGTSTLTLTIRNRVVTSGLTNVNLTDNLPSGVTLAANPAATNSCGGSLQAFPGDNKIILSNGSVAARPAGSQETTCTITARVTGTSLGLHTNTIQPTDFSTSEGTIPNNVSANLTITAGITAVKSFSPTSVTSGGVSRVKITVTNASNGDLTNVSIDDNTFSSGLTVANPANAATSCPGSPTMVVNPGATHAQLLGATLNAGASCDFSFDVVTSGAGPWSNTIPIGKITSAEGPFNTAAVSANLSANTAQININKSFNPVIVTGGVPSTLTLTLTNPSGATLHGVGFTDVFPTGIQVYSVPAVTSTCAGGTVTAIPGDGKVSLSGAVMPPGSTCNITLQTTSIKFLNLTNYIPAGAVVSSEGYTNPLQVAATLSTLQGLGVMKAFSPAYVTPNTVARLQMWLVSTFDPNAPTPLTLTGVSYTDTLPDGVLIAPVPNASTTCTGTGTGSLAEVTTSNNGVNNGLVTVSQATIPPNSICSISVDVIASELGVYTNIIPEKEIVSDQGETNNNGASANLYVVSQPTISKSFSPNTISVGGTSLLTVTISNGAPIPITGVDLTDTLPSGLAIAGTPAAATTCTNGSVTANPGSDTLALSGATIPAGGSCISSANVIGNTPGSYINNINDGELLSNEGLTNPGAANDTLTVRLTPTVSKSFNPVNIDGTGIAPDGISTLTITLGNGNTGAITLTSAFVDALPGNVFVATTPHVVKTCPGTVTANAGGINITYANGASIPTGGCTISVDVTSTDAGVHTNTIAAGQLQTSAGNNQDPAVADLAVGAGALVPPTVNKFFSPGTIDINGISTLTITFGNPNDSSLTMSSDFSDTLPANVFIAATPNASTTCIGGTLTANNGTNSITYSGGIIPGVVPGPSGCTITIDVTSDTEGSYTNTIPADSLITDGGNNREPATDSLVVEAPIPPTVNKTFDPATINPGGISRLVISFGNASGGDITLVSDFVDNLPVGVTVALTPNIGGTCTGGSITAEAGSGSITYASGATIPAGGCTIMVDVTTASSAGSPYTNTIGVNALQTTAGNNGAPATSKLFVNPPQPPSISKSFSPTSILAGTVSTLTISIGNGNAAGTMLTADLADTLPSNVVFASNPNIRVSSGCSLAHVVATAGGNTVTYQTGGTIPAGGCSIAVDVTSNTPNPGYVNTIPSGALQTGIGSNAVGTSATLQVVVMPDLTITKSHSGDFSVGQTGATYMLTVTNNGNGDKTAGNTVTVTENAPVGMTITGMSGPGWDCTTLPHCTRSDILSLGSSYPDITVTADVAVSAGPSLINSAGVSLDGQTESNTNNNNATDPTTVNSPNLYDPQNITKTVDGAGLPVLHYTAVIINSGSGSAFDAVFTDQIPINTTYVPDSITMDGNPVSDAYPDADGGYDAANTRLVINMGTILPGASVTITFDVTVAPDFYGIISNQGSVSGSNFPTEVTDDPTTSAQKDPTIFNISSPIPTLTQWGIIIFIVFAGVGAIYYLRKEKTTKGQ